MNRAKNFGICFNALNSLVKIENVNELLLDPIKPRIVQNSI